MSDLDAFHDAWLIVESAGLAELVEQTQARLDEAERAAKAGKRVRRRKPDEEERRRELVGNLIANLAHLQLHHPKGTRLVVHLKHRNRSRYVRPIFGQLSATIKGLQEIGLVIHHGAREPGLCTAITPSPTLLDLFNQRHTTPSDIGRAPGQETIILKARTDEERSELAPKMRGAVVFLEYLDSVRSRHMRLEMEEVNSFLIAAPITLDDDRGTPQPAPSFCLRRYFLGTRDSRRFNSRAGGRIFKGWWQNLPKTVRSRIRIDCEPIADLDYSAMFARLAYIKAGLEPPRGDLYRIAGLEEHRKGAKLALLALLSRRTPMSKLPAEVKAELPEGWTAMRVTAAFTEAHPRIAALFGRDVGVELQYTESEILLAVLLRLSRQGITALPMHDGIMVAQSRKGVAAGVMREESARVTGFELPMTEKLL